MVFLLFLLNRNVSGQNLDTVIYSSIHQLIPQDRKLYYISEFHIDRVIRNYYGLQHDTLIKTASLIEDTIRQILSKNCNVKSFLTEHPVSYEYYIKKYLKTGDELWLDQCLFGEYEKNKMRSIRIISQEDSEIVIRCIDAEPKSRYEYLLNVLYFLTLEAVDTGFQKLRSNFSPNSRYQDLYIPNVYFNDTINPFFKNLNNLFIGLDENNRKKLYKLLLNAKRDSILQQGLRNYYQYEYSYFIRLTESFLNSYDLKYKEKKTKPFWINREKIMFLNLDNVMKSNPSVNYCLQIGSAHIMPNCDFENIREMVERSLKVPYFYTSMLPQYYYDSFSYGPNAFSFEFDGKYKYVKDSENGMHSTY